MSKRTAADGNKVPAAYELPPVPSESSKAPTVSTFREWGFQLPVGFLQGSELHRGLGFRSWRGRTDRELEEHRASLKGSVTQPEWMVHVLSRMLVRFGPYDFDVLDDGMRRLVLTQAWVADVMFAILALRVSALGSEVRFDFQCGACGHKWRAPIDLDDMELKIPGGPEDLSRVHELRDGIEIGGKLYHRLVLDPPRWSALLVKAARKTVEVDATAALVVGSIRHALSDDDGSPVQVTADAAEDMTKFDWERLQKRIDTDHLGPQLDLVSVCTNPMCEHENHHGLDWSWQFLFKSASL